MKCVYVNLDNLTEYVDYSDWVETQHINEINDFKEIQMEALGELSKLVKYCRDGQKDWNFLEFEFRKVLFKYGFSVDTNIIHEYIKSNC